MSLTNSIWPRSKWSTSVTLAWAEGWAEAEPQSTGRDVIGSCGPSRALGEVGSCPMIISILQEGAEFSSSVFAVCD